MAALALVAGASMAEAHRPPPGYALEHRAEVAGHVVEVMVVPKEPSVGDKVEVIVNLRERDSGLPYQGYVTFLMETPTGVAGPMAVPTEFGPGQFESGHIFREPGIHALSIVFDAEGSEQRGEPIPVTVRRPSRVPGGIALTLTFLTAVTYAAAFRRSRRRRPSGPLLG